MSRVFKKMLKDARPVYFIVDALDECEKGLKDLIRLISTSLSLSNNVRWLVSGHPEVDVLSKLKNSNGCRIVHLKSPGLGGPVDAYIGHKLSTLGDKERVYRGDFGQCLKSNSSASRAYFSLRCSRI